MDIHLLGPNQTCSCKARHVCQSCQGQDDVNARLLAALEEVVAAVAPTTLGTNELSMIFRRARSAIKEAKK